jgi:acyl carrier protein
MVINMNEIIKELKAYFTDISSTELKGSDNLFETGVLDSMGIMKLLVFIEEKFKISAEAEEITEDNFKSLNAIAQLISGKLK